MKRGWTLDRAAQEASLRGTPVKRGTIYAIEEGISSDPSSRRIMALAALYGIPVEELGPLVFIATKENGRRAQPGGKRRGQTTAGIS